jgi:hypothetical protein
MGKGPKSLAIRRAFGLFPSIALVVAAILACGDPAWSLHGTVVDGAGAPIPGATVNVRCPGPKPLYDTDKTDPKGEVNMGGIPDAPAGCSVEVVAAGHATHTFPMTAFCYRSTSARNFGTPCPAGGTKVVLP